MSGDTDKLELEIGQVVFVAVGSRLGERGWIKRRDRTYVWLEPVDSEQPLGYYAVGELSVDGMPLCSTLGGDRG